MDNDSIETALQIIRDSDRVLVVSHIRPDGDAVGSVLGLGLSLLAVGKDVQMVLDDGVPKSFRHLTGSDRVVQNAEMSFDCSIVVDCSDIGRTGRVFENNTIPDINIDHHNTNLNFARINIVDAAATATTEILARLLPSWEIPINLPVAEALLTGIITDTLGFRVPSMSPETLRIAANLYEIGADLPTLYTKALLTRSFRAAKFWGTGLTSLKLEDRLAWTRLTLADRDYANYPGKDDADLINILQTIEDADIFLIFVDQTDNRVKVSWRARKGFDVSKIAVQFGGGGHKPAAGADIQGNIDTIIDEVLDATRSLLNEHQNH
ncbi:MAG: DHH family phosphoesterase [Anaerolineales bacterium]